MLFLAYVMRWQADDWKRVRDNVNGTQYLLNTYRLDSIRVHTGTAASGTSSLYYFDNPFDSRDSGHYMILDYPVDDLIHEINTVLNNNFITLAIFPNNDPTETPVDTDIGVANFAYAVAQVNHPTRSWVTYSEAGWDLKTVLVDNTLADLLGMV